MPSTWQKLTLRFVGVLGTTLFGAFFALTWSVPEWVEEAASDYIEAQAQSRIDATIDALSPPASESALGRFAESLYESNEERIDGLRSRLKDSVNERWRTALVSIRDMDCECRLNWERGLESEVGLLQMANERIVQFIHGTYMDVASALKRDVRVFAGSNAAVFLFLLLLSLLKPKALTHLLVPAALLTVSTLACSYFYVFEQDWLLTIVQGSYLGFAYLAWLGVVTLFLCDIAFNRGRVTTEVLGALLNAAVAPC
ncbi:MAG: hypothetical protein AB8H86_31855 [Polyangiales bacterium]